MDDHGFRITEVGHLIVENVEQTGGRNSAVGTISGSQRGGLDPGVCPVGQDSSVKRGKRTVIDGNGMKFSERTPERTSN